MTETHPNIALLSRFDPANIAGTADIFADDFVWYFFNPRLPNLQGDHVGRDGLRAFFKQMAKLTNGTFKVNPVGDELLVTHTRNTMVLEGEQIETDAVVVWCIVDGPIVEAWDIPAVYSVRV